MQSKMGSATEVLGGEANNGRYDTVLRATNLPGLHKQTSSTLSNNSAHQACSELSSKSAYMQDELTSDELLMQQKVGFVMSIEKEKALPRRKREKVQYRLWDMGASLDRKIAAVENALKFSRSRPKLDTRPPPADTELEIDTFFYHNPPSMYPQRNNAPPSTVSSAAESIYRTITGKRREQERRPTINSMFGSENNGSNILRRGTGLDQAINDWVDASTAERGKFGFQDDYFMACTPTQLEELDQDVLSRVRVVKSYIGPPSSPTSEASDEFNAAFHFPISRAPDRLRIDPLTRLTNLIINDISNYVDFVPLDPTSIHTTLARSLGLRSTGIQVLGTSLPYTYDQTDNMSPYYFLPIIETAEQTRQFYHSSRLKTVIDFNDGREWEDDAEQTVTYLPKNVGIREETVPRVWLRKKDFLPKKTQPPVKSFILYLLGKGISVNAIADTVSDLDEKFVNEWTSRWWNGLRIPEHWEFDDSMVGKVCVSCKAEKHWWEEELNLDPAMIKLMHKMKRRKAKILVKNVIEEYLWWRLRGGEKLGNDGGVYGTVGQASLVGFHPVAPPRHI